MSNFKSFWHFPPTFMYKTAHDDDQEKRLQRLTLELIFFSAVRDNAGCKDEGIFLEMREQIAQLNVERAIEKQSFKLEQN